MVQSLRADTLRYIFLFISPTEAIQATRVCRAWREAIETQGFWEGQAKRCSSYDLQDWIIQQIPAPHRFTVLRTLAVCHVLTPEDDEPFIDLVGQKILEQSPCQSSLIDRLTRCGLYGLADEVYECAKVDPPQEEEADYHELLRIADTERASAIGLLCSYVDVQKRDGDQELESVLSRITARLQNLTLDPGLKNSVLTELANAAIAHIGEQTPTCKAAIRDRCNYLYNLSRVSVETPDAMLICLLQDLVRSSPQQKRPVAALIKKVADALHCEDHLRDTFIDWAKETIPDTFAPTLSQEERTHMFVASLYNWNLTTLTKSAIINMLFSLGIIHKRERAKMSGA